MPPTFHFRRRDPSSSSTSISDITLSSVDSLSDVPPRPDKIQKPVSTASLRRAARAFDVEDMPWREVRERANLTLQEGVHVCRDQMEDYLRLLFEDDDEEMCLYIHDRERPADVYGLLLYSVEKTHYFIRLVCSHSRHGRTLVGSFLSRHDDLPSVLDTVTEARRLYHAFGFRSFTKSRMVHLPEKWTPAPTEVVVGEMKDSFTSLHMLHLREAAGSLGMNCPFHPDTEETLVSWLHDLAAEALSTQGSWPTPPWSSLRNAEIRVRLQEAMKNGLGAILWQHNDLYDNLLWVVVDLLQELARKCRDLRGMPLSRDMLLETLDKLRFR